MWSGKDLPQLRNAPSERNQADKPFCLCLNLCTDSLWYVAVFINQLGRGSPTLWELCVSRSQRCALSGIERRWGKAGTESTKDFKKVYEREEAVCTISAEIKNKNVSSNVSVLSSVSYCHIKKKKKSLTKCHLFTCYSWWKASIVKSHFINDGFFWCQLLILK